MSRIATTTEAVDALLEYSKLFVSLDGHVDVDAMDSIAESIAIVRNTVNDDVVCVPLDTQSTELKPV